VDEIKAVGRELRRRRGLTEGEVFIVGGRV
jgi:hypothetical protein